MVTKEELKETLNVCNMNQIAMHVRNIQDIINEIGFDFNKELKEYGNFIEQPILTHEDAIEQIQRQLDFIKKVI